MLIKTLAVSSLLVAVITAANYPRVNEVCISDAECFDNFEYCS